MCISKKLCQVAKMFDFAAGHQMASSTFHVKSLQSNAITWNILKPSGVRKQNKHFNNLMCTFFDRNVFQILQAFEDNIRKSRTLMVNWIKYAGWEESQKEIQR